MDAQVTYTPGFADGKLALTMSVFNLFNNQKVTEYNEFSGQGSGASNAFDPNYLNDQNYQTPRSLRFSARYEF